MLAPLWIGLVAHDGTSLLSLASNLNHNKSVDFVPRACTVQVLCSDFSHTQPSKVRQFLLVRNFVVALMLQAQCPVCPICSPTWAQGPEHCILPASRQRLRCRPTFLVPYMLQEELATGEAQRSGISSAFDEEGLPRTEQLLDRLFITPATEPCEGAQQPNRVPQCTPLFCRVDASCQPHAEILESSGGSLHSEFFPPEIIQAPPVVRVCSISHASAAFVHCNPVQLHPGCPPAT
mmetsp:Transcript_92925/g.184472  ORF Transcript_92925/g.184472 Transcript_92925/m.184472 type:complete len:235 (+) Transcript_92925:1577-2281(+)